MGLVVPICANIGSNEKLLVVTGCNYKDIEGMEGILCKPRGREYSDLDIEEDHHWDSDFQSLTLRLDGTLDEIQASLPEGMVVRRDIFQDFEVISLFERLIQLFLIRTVLLIPERITVHNTCHQGLKLQIALLELSNDLLNGTFIIILQLPTQAVREHFTCGLTQQIVQAFLDNNLLQSLGSGEVRPIW